MTFRKSREFPGIAFSYDEQAQPFFKAIVKDNLRKLRVLNTGRMLLQAIAAANPGYRANFERGVNVVIHPPLERIWITPGMKKTGAVVDQKKYDDFQAGAGKLIPTMASKTAAQEENKAAATGGTGSVCTLFYSNNEIVSASGEWLPPHITMGHELIHCHHALYGVMRVDNREEEYFTVGMKNQAGMYTENMLRNDANIPLRTKYFAND